MRNRVDRSKEKKSKNFEHKYVHKRVIYLFKRNIMSKTVHAKVSKAYIPYF